MKRSLSALLLIAMLASLAACGGTAPEVADTTAEGGENTPETTADPLDDELPEMDLGGYEFRFYTYGDNVKMYVPDGENGDVVNDATYKRNRTVEERFNVKITSIDSGATKEAEQRTKLQNMILAGDESFDVALNIGKHLACQTIMGHYLNLYDVEYLNFSKPWWSAQLVEDLTFMDTMFIGSNNLHYEEFAASKVYFFNKKRAEDYKLEDPYQLVFDGKWTIDKLVSMTKDVYEDVNGDGQKDKGDFYGMLTTISHNSWAVVFDIPVWEKEKDSLKCVALSDRMIEAFDIIHSWYYDSQGLYTWKSYAAAKTEMRQMFIDGRGLFTFGFVGDSGTYYRDTEVDYGMLPYPKFDETQEDYRVFFSANSSSMFAIPIFASDPSRTGLIIEALSAEGYKQLIPVYYEIALKDKYLRDDTSIKMLDLITDARTISFSYCYDNWDAGLGFGNCFQSDYASSFATFYAGREAIVAARLKEVTEAFADAK